MFPELLSPLSSLGWPSVVVVALVLSFRIAAMLIAARTGYRLTQKMSGFIFEPGAIPQQTPHPQLPSTRARLRLSQPEDSCDESHK